MVVDKPNAPACERNRDPILTIIRPLLADKQSLLEIGSGTGQHAVYFADALPYLKWQPTDLAANLPGIHAWVDDAKLPNIQPPLALDVTADWPSDHYDAMFTANTLHIMGMDGVEAFFAGAGKVLAIGGLLMVYGPFNYDGQYTSASNADFDLWLKNRDPASAIRDFEVVDKLAQAAGLQLLADHTMPANNRLLVWQRQA